MHFLRCLVALALLTSCGRKTWVAPNPEAHAAALAEAIEAMRDDESVPGAAVKVQTPKGEWVYVSGNSQDAPPRPVDRFDRFPIRDITVAYVVTVILILADENVLRLDDPASKFAPGAPEGVTIRQLASMRSGLVDYTATDAFRARDPSQSATPFDLLALADPSPQIEPGSQYAYSRTNALWLGEVILGATGKTWFELVRERMLEPVKLFRTEWPVGTTPLEPFARGHDGTAPATPRNFSALAAAAGLTTTIDELATFGRALAEGAFLSTFMHTQRLTYSLIAEDDTGPFAQHYGLGLMELDGLYGHSGEGYGYASAVWHEPQSDTTIAILTNASGTPTRGATSHLAEALARILGWPGK